jgi:F-type H+-transporting ATPase subunit alpha
MRNIEKKIEHYSPALQMEEIGHIRYIGEGIVQAEGLGKVKSEELVVLGPGIMGMVMDILPDQIGIVLLESGHQLRAGDDIYRTERVLDVPVGEGFMGRIIDPLGRPLDESGSIDYDMRLPVHREAPPIIHRSPVEKPLQTGLKVIDALIPIGLGQRELILGDRQTGKTAIALATIINQQDKNVRCIYCAIGQRSTNIARTVDLLREKNALSYSVIMVAEGNDSPGMQYIAPYAATTIAEHFMAQGQDVLIVYDDLTRHALAYRQLSLLMRRPPGREAFPGDIFYIHSQLLERSTHLRPEQGGGSLTAMPIIETQAQNISAYIPTNLISITDGQIYLSPDFFQKAILPAVDVGKSVSRVGGKAQFPAYRKFAGDLRLSYSQFQELESFARFGTRLDQQTRDTLEHGKRVREILKQKQFDFLSSAEQIAVLWITSQGVLDDIPVDQIESAEQKIVEWIRSNSKRFEEIDQARPEEDVWQELLDEIQSLVVKT